MSFVNAGDPRAHTSPEEKARHSRAIVAFARGLALEDQPNGVEPCKECLGQTLMLALGELVRDVAEADLTCEKLGLARRFHALSKIARQTESLLTLSAGLDDDGVLRELLAA